MLNELPVKVTGIVVGTAEVHWGLWGAGKAHALLDISLTRDRIALESSRFRCGEGKSLSRSWDAPCEVAAVALGSRFSWWQSCGPTVLWLAYCGLVS